MKKYKMDLHIHTPASKCYLGPKNDDEYFEILKSASEQEIEIMAITDHNTIEGYKHLMQLKENVLKKIEFLEQYQNESQRMKEEYDDMISKKELFDNILILPGVEVTLNPGIHMLVIGNGENIEILSEILDDTGYDYKKRGSDNDNSIDVDVINFLKNPKLNGLIISAPHIDSKNGIYKEIDGQYRSSIMKNAIITSFSINSDTQKENIIRMFSTDPEYKRENMPAFINCSDAHESTKVGSKYSYVELELKSFDKLKELFDNPAGRITDIDDDRLIATIKNILKREDALLVGRPDDKLEEISKTLCAVLNEDIPVLIFGIDENLKLLGVNDSDNTFESRIDSAFNRITSSACSIGYSIKSYKLGNGRYVYILIIKQDERYLWYLKEEKEVYYLVDNKASLAGIEDIEKIVYDNALKDLFQIEQKDEERLNRANIQINSTKSRTDKAFVLKQIVEGCYPILKYCNIDICEASKLSENLVEQIPDNGSVTGNSYYIFKNAIRLSEAVLRFSCPTAFLSGEILEAVKSFDVKKDSIVIVRGGGTHYIPETGKIFGINEAFIVLSAKENTNFNMKVLLAWMKSSLFTWYISRKLGSTDIYLPSILTNSVFPIEKIENEKDLVSVVDKVISLEQEFLKNYEKLPLLENINFSETPDSWELFSIVDKHNNMVALEMRNVDKYFFDLFGIEENGIKWIGDDLKAESIYDYLTEDIFVAVESDACDSN